MTIQIPNVRFLKKIFSAMILKLKAQVFKKDKSVPSSYDCIDNAPCQVDDKAMTNPFDHGTSPGLIVDAFTIK